MLRAANTQGAGPSRPDMNAAGAGTAPLLERAAPLEIFAALERLAGIRHGFTHRVPGVDVHADRRLALDRLESAHATARSQHDLGAHVFVTGEQVHGRDIAVVDAHSPVPAAAVDGLITADPRVCLGIYVADCCPVYLVDPVRRVIGLLHSGRKGSELGITAAALARMRREFGCEPADMTILLGPCIRPPNYEIDFAALIRRDCEAAGVGVIADSGICTAANLDRYYSYRAERGKTGRMLAFLALVAL
jgi:polyphenol oxidase